MRKSAIAVAVLELVLFCAHGLLGAPDGGDDAVPATTPTTRPALTNTLEMKLVYIPPGEFKMGDTRDFTNARPHNVKLTRGFYMASTPVTQAQWKAIMGSDPSLTKGDQMPAENMTWHEAMEFCKKLSAKEGKTYTLPTEAQWEYACRAGATTEFYNGDDEKTLGDIAWYRDNCNDTHPVGQKKPNAWGLYDMLGNVGQWCRDNTAPYPDGDATDPTGPAQDAEKVIRGGSWNNRADDCRCAARSGNGPSGHGRTTGLRVCLPDDAK